MLFGVSTACLYGRAETEDALRILSVIEPDCFECFLQCDEEYGAAFGRLLCKNAGDTPIRAIHTHSPTYEPSIFSASNRQRAHSLTKLSLAMDAGEACGAISYTFHGIARYKHGAYKPNYDRVAECMAPLVEAARQRGMVIAWETVYWGSFAMPEFAVEVAKRLPGIRFTLDLKQAHLSGYDWREYLASMGERFVHLHVGGLSLPGRVDFDYADLFSHMRGFDGAAMLEPYADMFKDVAELKAGLDFLRELV